MAEPMKNPFDEWENITVKAKTYTDFGSVKAQIELDRAAIDAAARAKGKDGYLLKISAELIAKHRSLELKKLEAIERRRAEALEKLALEQEKMTWKKVSATKEAQMLKDIAKAKCRAGLIPACYMRSDLFGVFEIWDQYGYFEETTDKDTRAIECYWTVRGMCFLREITLERVAEIVERERSGSDDDDMTPF
jgi:hypothetical protein